MIPRPGGVFRGLPGLRGLDVDEFPQAREYVGRVFKVDRVAAGAALVRASEPPYSGSLPLSAWEDGLVEAWVPPVVGRVYRAGPDIRPTWLAGRLLLVEEVDGLHVEVKVKARGLVKLELVEANHFDATEGR